jgi:CelD/BcsL family acetyltransferase involved in cellulose biosynthesis
MIAISGASWKAQSSSDMLTNKPIADFYRDFSREAGNDGFWLLHMLKINDSYVAFDYYLKFGNRLTGIRSDYDMSFKDYMPGHLVKIATIKYICSTGEPWEYDMGGIASEYKLSYTNEVRNHIHIMAGSTGPYGHLLIMGKRKFWPMLKRLHIPAFEHHEGDERSVPAGAGH